MDSATIAIARTEPNAALIDTLRRLLAEAEAGEIRGIVYISIRARGASGAIAGDADARDAALAVLDLQHMIQTRDDP